MRVLGALFLIVVVVFAAGLALDWWSVASEAEAGSGRRRIAVDVDSGEMQRDAAAVREGFRDLTGAEPDVVGVVRAVRADPPGLTVETAEGTLELTLSADVEIELDDEDVPLSALELGDRVALELDDDDPTVVDEIDALR